jgi:hypothetical protein
MLLELECPLYRRGLRRNTVPVPEITGFDQKNIFCHIKTLDSNFTPGVVGYSNQKPRVRYQESQSAPISVPNPDPDSPIHMFLGLSDPDPLDLGMDPDPSIVKQNSEKNLDSYCFCDFFCTFYL